MQLLLVASLLRAAAPHAVSVAWAVFANTALASWGPCVSEAALLGLMLCLCLGLASCARTNLPHWAFSASEAALLGLALCLRRDPATLTRKQNRIATLDLGPWSGGPRGGGAGRKCFF